MRWKLAAVVLGVVCLGMVASANAGFVWDSTPDLNARVLLKFANYEQVHDGLALPTQRGDMVEGIFVITQIVDKDNAAIVYWNQKVGQHLPGYFQNYLYDGANGPPFPAAPFSLNSTGGLLKIFFDGSTASPGGLFDPRYHQNDLGAVGHGAGYDGAVNPSFSLWLDTVGVPGIVLVDDPLTAVDERLTTLHTTFDAATSPFTGKGTGYLDVIGGDFANVFLPNVFGPGADLFLQSDIKAPGDPPSDPWPASSHDPVEGQFIPEPASLVIWGALAALFGLVAIRRWKR